MSLQLYDSRWDTIKKEEAIVDVDGRWSKIGSKLKAALMPMLREIRDAEKNYEEK